MGKITIKTGTAIVILVATAALSSGATVMATRLDAQQQQDASRRQYYQLQTIPTDNGQRF